MKINEQDLQPEQILFNYCKTCHPRPGSAEELQQFKEIQEGFCSQFELFFPDNLAHKTIVVIVMMRLLQFHQHQMYRSETIQLYAMDFNYFLMLPTTVQLINGMMDILAPFVLLTH